MMQALSDLPVNNSGLEARRAGWRYARREEAQHAL